MLPQEERIRRDKIEVISEVITFILLVGFVVYMVMEFHKGVKQAEKKQRQEQVQLLNSEKSRHPSHH